MDQTALATPRKRRSLALLVVGILVAAIAGYWVVYRCPLPFVASWWNVDSVEGTTLQTRYRVADYLALTGRLQGMTRPEVVALLGQPADTDKFRRHSMTYVLGPERGLFRIDDEWLAIDLDPSGKVSSVAVVRD